MEGMAWTGTSDRAWKERAESRRGGGALTERRKDRSLRVGVPAGARAGICPRESR